MAYSSLDYYSILGLTKTATIEEIKKSFRQLARQYHPDLNGGDKKAEARFKEINEAYEILSDPENRQKYDHLGSTGKTPLHRQASKPQGNSSLDDFEFDRYSDFNDFLQQYLGKNPY